jgi:hypothetical protein
MKIRSQLVEQAIRIERAGLGRLALASLASFLLASVAYAADPGKPGSGGKSNAVSFEPIAGSKAKRVILTEKAAERLGIETGRVGEETIVRKQVVGGTFVLPSPSGPGVMAKSGPSGSFAVERNVLEQGPGAMAVARPALASTAASASSEATGGSIVPKADLGGARPIAIPASPGPGASVSAPASVVDGGLVRVMLSAHEWGRLAKGQPARVFRLSSRGDRDNGVMATPSATPPAEDFKRSMLTYFYVVSGNDHGLEPNERVRVELPLEGSDAKRKVVPYSAVYYDARGDAWVYLNRKLLTYERAQIKIDEVIGDKAVLSSGPDVDATVVTVGAALLYGAEIYGK